MRNIIRLRIICNVLFNHSKWIKYFALVQTANYYAFDILMQETPTKTWAENFNKRTYLHNQLASWWSFYNLCCPCFCRCFFALIPHFNRIAVCTKERYLINLRLLNN